MVLPFSWRTKQPPAPLQLRFKREHEARHWITCADNGSGKSQFIKQLLYYAEACGDTCVILDAKQEFLPEFYNPERGDVILDPNDDRCPYWHPGDEVTGLADSLQVSRAIYPQDLSNSQSKFFLDSAAQVGAYLLYNYNPSCQEYGDWLDDDAEIDKRIKGTRLERTLSKNAAGQRSAILAYMNAAAIPFQMMPSEEGRPRFSIKDWCQHRNGHIFLPNPHDAREAMRPLISMWADLIMLRLMAMGKRPDLPRVWLFYDELDSLNHLPQLQSAMSEMRFTGNPMVLGFQNMAQLEDRYGKKAETIFSQAYTKYIGATSHGPSAKSLQDLVGEVEVKRLKVTYSHQRLQKSRSETVEIIRQPLLLASEIQELPDLQGYIIQRGKVVKVKLPYLEPIERQPKHIPRTVERPLLEVEEEPEEAPEPEHQAKPKASPKLSILPKPQQESVLEEV